jgi:hypothetical protein
MLSYAAMRRLEADPLRLLNFHSIAACGVAERLSAAMSMRSLALPSFGIEQTAAALMPFDACEACGGECLLGIWQMGDAKSCKQAECKVQGADVSGSNGPQQGVARYSEVGDDPEAAGRDLCGEPLDEGIDLGLREAVEEEVGRDEIGVRRGIGLEGGAMDRCEAGGGAGGRAQAALLQQSQHLRARVHRRGVKRGVLGHEASKEAAIAISEDERVAAILQLREEVEARAFQ